MGVVQQEMLFDFSLHMPRILVSGNVAVLDNARRVVSMDQQSITVDTGKTYIVLNGEALVIKRLEEERIIINGKISGIEFHRKG